MKQILLLFLFGISFITVKAQVTWAQDISCILYTHCTNCHNPNGIAPFSLVNYNEAYPLRQAIQVAVNNKEMPPWPADPSYQTHAYERTLSQIEITLINEWVNIYGGAEGDPAIAPPPPVYINSEEIDNPDLVLSVPNYASQAGTDDDYRCFVVQNPNNVDTYITGMEFVPGNSSLVHHILLFKDASNGPANSDNNDPDPGYVCFGGTGSSSSKMIGAWAPGGQPNYLPAGMGLFVEAGSDFVIQIHYPAGTSGQVDMGSKINLTLSTDPTTRGVQTDFVLNYWSTMTNGPIIIMPGDYAMFYEEYTVPTDLTVLSVFPHMHLIGEWIKSYAITPSGDQINFIDIPHWDFEWQGSYTFRQPIKIPAGSILKAEAFYNNSASNPHNPFDPPQVIFAGEATTNEMMLVGFSYTPYQVGDENIVIDNTVHPTEYCDTVSAILPIELSRFWGESINGQNILEWVVSDENNLKHYEVQRSWNGTDFTAIGVVEPTGLSSSVYQFTDKSTIAGINYYRIKIVEINEEFTFSDIINLKVGLVESSFIVSPNPAFNNVEIGTKDKTIKSIQVYNTSGVLLKEKYYINQPSSKYILNVDELVAGMYILKVNFENSGQSVSRKLILY